MNSGEGEAALWAAFIMLMRRASVAQRRRRENFNGFDIFAPKMAQECQHRAADDARQ